MTSSSVRAGHDAHHGATAAQPEDPNVYTKESESNLDIDDLLGSVPEVDRLAGSVLARRRRRAP